MPRWNKILVHHSAGFDGVVSDFEAIKRQHVEVNGWQTIGYHALIERVGDKIVDRDGRPEYMNGSHCPGQNAMALGVCLVGNFEVESVGEKMLDALVDRLTRWCVHYRISPSQIYGHRDFRSTLCPGRNLYARIASLRSQVHERVDSLK